MISALVVFVIFIVHLQSFFLALMAIITIGLSIGVTAFIYEGVVQVTFVSYLNGLVVFIVIGVAADDFFVLHDAWE